jgi:hypothetical protein
VERAIGVLEALLPKQVAPQPEAEAAPAVPEALPVATLPEEPKPEPAPEPAFEVFLDGRHTGTTTRKRRFGRS